MIGIITDIYNPICSLQSLNELTNNKLTRKLTRKNYNYDTFSTIPPKKHFKPFHKVLIMKGSKGTINKRKEVVTEG